MEVGRCSAKRLVFVVARGSTRALPMVLSATLFKDPPAKGVECADARAD